jgi:membrane-bound metal-dependent hydrolase YbcI (DUF457 family)
VGSNSATNLYVAAARHPKVRIKLIICHSTFDSKEEKTSFAVGHLALGYILGEASAKTLKTNVNIPLILTLSVIPDVDILIPFIAHRGPTHSLISTLIIFTPFFLAYRQKAAPYFIALIQHSLIGDYIAGGGIQLLWPVTTQHFGTSLSMKSQTIIAIEWITFLTSMVIMLKTKETATLLKPHTTNLILTIPTFTVLLPTFLSYPQNVPELLIPPHLVYMAVFLTSITIDLHHIAKEAYKL